MLIKVFLSVMDSESRLPSQPCWFMFAPRAAFNVNYIAYHHTHHIRGTLLKLNQNHSGSSEKCFHVNPRVGTKATECMSTELECRNNDPIIMSLIYMPYEHSVC
ncbi:hypothetical protein GOODEAATRI_022446, partial [Goodea atripinnis]